MMRPRLDQFGNGSGLTFMSGECSFESPSRWPGFNGEASDTQS